MKELKNKWSRALMVLFVITAAFSASCSKDDDDNDGPDTQTDTYVGTWSSEETDQSEFIQVLTLTKNSFDAIIKTQNEQGQWENTFALKGSMTVNGNKMNVHISEFGSSLNPMTGENTGTIIYYQEGSLLFDTFMASTGREKDFQSEYTVGGNKLTLMTHLNDDDDYTDPEETMIYTRQ